MQQSITLSVGQLYHLRTGKDRIIYAGMPSEEAYSIVQWKNAAMNNAVSWNLFFSKKQRSITIDSITINVESVTPEEIRLRVM